MHSVKAEGSGSSIYLESLIRVPKARVPKQVCPTMSFELFPEPQVKSPGNARPRRGRGFSTEETGRAGLTITEARQMGLIVDLRRKTVHDENVEVLKRYVEELDKVIAEVKRVKPEPAKKPVKKEPAKKEPVKKTPEKEPTKKKAPKKEPVKKTAKEEPAKKAPAKKKPTKKEEKAIAELSSLRAVKKEEAEKLVAAGIVTLSDLAFCEIDEVAKKSDIDVNRISAMMTAALKRI
ncbi:MAG: ribosomal protein L13e [Candidatus Thorarchaeota archaeon]|nr:MAG: ribosomal protein L13e [Candidatus Thorarchaeota archaeon]